MHAVVATLPGVLELNYSWLPTWIGMNAQLKREVEEALHRELENQPLDLDRAHKIVVSFLTSKFPNIVGLEDHLDGLKFIEVR